MNVAYDSFPSCTERLPETERPLGRCVGGSQSQTAPYTLPFRLRVRTDVRHIKDRPKPIDMRVRVDRQTPK